MTINVVEEGMNAKACGLQSTVVIDVVWEEVPPSR